MHPISATAWWCPVLRTGKDSPDNFLDALSWWAEEHRLTTAEGTTLINDFTPLLRTIQGAESRLVQISQGSYEELPCDAESLSLVEQSGNTALLFGRTPVGRDGPMEADLLLTARFLAPQTLLWTLTPVSIDLPPLVNERPAAALGVLRSHEKAVIAVLSKEMRQLSEKQQHQCRDALCEIEQREAQHDGLALPSGLPQRYADVLHTTAYVHNIVIVARQYHLVSESLLGPLYRTAQRVQTVVWNEWMMSVMNQ